MSKLIKKKIKDVIIYASDGSNPPRAKLVIEDILPPKKVTSTWYPQLYDDTRFNKRGDKLLEFYRLLESDPFDNYYTLRGYVAEKYISDFLKKKDYKVHTFDESWDLYNYHTEHPMGKLYAYFGGRPDIIYEDADGKRHLIEVKSKSLDKKQYVIDSPPETEIMQGKMLALLEGLDAVDMTYVMFSEKLEVMMRLATKNTNPFNLKEAYKLLVTYGIDEQLKGNIEVHKKTYLVDKKVILEQMKTAYKYAETFRQTHIIDLDDLSKEVKHEIFELEREIEDERKRIQQEQLERANAKKSRKTTTASQTIANNPLYKQK